MHQLFRKQFEKPQGYIGSLIAWAMDRKNEERSEYTLTKLQVQPNEELLEIGFGTGRTIEKVQSLLQNGRVTGVDHSTLMLNRAIERNELAIKEGKVMLHDTCLWEFSTQEDYYDTVYASNVHEFWRNPVTEFRFMRELLKEGGKLVLVHQPKSSKSVSTIQEHIQKLIGQFVAAGFENIVSDFKKMESATCISVTGYK